MGKNTLPEPHVHLLDPMGFPLMVSVVPSILGKDGIRLKMGGEWGEEEIAGIWGS